MAHADDTTKFIARLAGPVLANYALNNVIHVGRRHAFEWMARRIPASRTTECATLKPEHCPPARPVGAADRNESMHQHRAPTFQ